MRGGNLADNAPSSLAERILAGDRSAEDEFVATFRERVFYMALAATRDREAARDMSQEAMLQVLDAVRSGRLRQAESLAGFVHGTARNLIRYYLRGQRTSSADPATSPDPKQESPEQMLDSSERLALVRRGLKRLGASDRLILLMTLVDGLKPGEIAERLGLKGEVVRQRKCRAVRQIVEDVKRWSRSRGGRNRLGE